MGCEPFEMDDGNGGKLRGYICSRGGRAQKRCACGKPSTSLCDFPDRSVPQARIGRRRTTPTCSAPLCADCAAHVGTDRDLCPTHMQMARAAGAPGELLADPSPGALQVLADLCEQRGLLRRPPQGAVPGRRGKGRHQRDPAPAAATQRGLFDSAPATGAHAASTAITSPGTCRPGDGAAALRELDRIAAKDEAGSWARTRSDCLDPEAIDHVLAPDAAFRPRDHAEWREYVSERAAIFEFLAGRPRSVAEVLARQLAGPPPRHERSGPLFAGARPEGGT
jgi:hypothetical protein